MMGSTTSRMNSLGELRRPGTQRLVLLQPCQLILQDQLQLQHPRLHLHQLQPIPAM